LLPPRFTEDGRLVLPADYREGVYLSSGFDMAYRPMAMGHHMFNNVFVEPGAYKALLATGTWPDKTMLVLEVRGAMDKGSIKSYRNRLVLVQATSRQWVVRWYWCVSFGRLERITIPTNSGTEKKR
jgi:hypothetical protein